MRNPLDDADGWIRIDRLVLRMRDDEEEEWHYWDYSQKLPFMPLDEHVHVVRANLSSHPGFVMFEIQYTCGDGGGNEYYAFPVGDVGYLHLGQK